MQMEQTMEMLFLTDYYVIIHSLTILSLEFFRPFCYYFSDADADADGYRF